MKRGAVYLLILLNLAVLVYSARMFLGVFHYPFRLYLLVFRFAVPLALFIVAAVSGSVFLLNATVPFLVVYGPVHFLRSKDFTFLLATQLSLLTVLIDLLYIIAANRKLKNYRSLFWGFLLGVILFFAYHKLQFGIDPNLTLPVLKVYGGLVKEIEKAF